jgi:aldehyde:ferredoxin oxidoreductase
LFGYAGQILYVDLSTGKTRVEKLDESMAQKYIGGVGLGMKLWLDNAQSGVDSLSSENPLVLAIGPVAGTMFPTGGNGHVFVSKSPASRAVAGSVAYGSFGAELKRAGYDAVVLMGKSSKSVYLWIDDGSVQLLSANRLLGKSPSETEGCIKEELGDYYIRVASIGVAGEKHSKISSIINDKTRSAGRIGLGAVMGSKNLKAIAVRGTHDVVPAKPEEFMDMVQEFHTRMKSGATKKYTKLGTVQDLLGHNVLNCLPTRNFNNAHFENAEKVSGEALNAQFVAKIIACGTCPMPCEHEVIVPEGPYKGCMIRMEYESLWALGPYCGVDKLDVIVKAVALCNYYGLDAQSVGVTIGFIMDCHEKGILTQQDLGGIDAHFGNAEALLQLVEKIGKREGIGDTLADGVRAAADKIGKASQKLAQHIKGLEIPGYDLRFFKTAALGFAVSFSGADNDNYSFDGKGKVDPYAKCSAKHVADLEDTDALAGSFMVCKFSKVVFHKEYLELAKLYSLVTGFKITPEDLKNVGERITTLTRVINIREGLSRKDDNLPWKVMHEPILDEGPTKGAILTTKDLDTLLDDYYKTRGWTQNGVPTTEKLQELDLNELSVIVEGKQEA